MAMTSYFPKVYFNSLFWHFCHVVESSSSVLIYLDTTSTRTTARSTTITATKATMTTIAGRHAKSTTILIPLEQGIPDITTRPAPSSQLPSIVTEGCEPVGEPEISWPKTRQGQVAKQPCPPGMIGNVKNAS